MGGLSLTSKIGMLAVVSAMGVATPGCIVSGSRHVEIEGRYIGEQTLSMVEPGKTDKVWVLAVMGEPTRRNVLPDGEHEVWVWEYRRIRHADTEVLLVFDGDKRSETSQSVYVEFAGNVVSRTWRDAAH